MTRAARIGRVLFVEEPEPPPALDPAPVLIDEPVENVTVVRPRVPRDTPQHQADALCARAVRKVLAGWQRGPFVLWHYSGMAEPQSRGLEAIVTVYDCMDELASFKEAPPLLAQREAALLRRADLVFAGGHALHELKRERHRSVHVFPSSVDLHHFAAARHEQPEPAALRGIPHPRFVYAGVIDERLDLGLVRALGAANIGEVVMIGPTAKVEEDDVPRGPSIHYLGMQRYGDLPALFAHADVGIMPFALNEATRYISPTKTPEYLAAGLPVVTTPVRDVVRSYGDLAAVRVAADADAFVAAVREAATAPRRWAEVDARLAQASWDRTWAQMLELIEEAARSRDKGGVGPAAVTPGRDGADATRAGPRSA